MTDSEAHQSISPILGIFGHRQVGKTTFVHHTTSHYLTFDSISEKRNNPVSLFLLDPFDSPVVKQYVNPSQVE
ncbi:MAG: hypothetical protein KA715_14500 [Xanthomonadaceae bacterium]|nr:hypothetical protein [Xanthomonadaceae bacterium]